MKNLRMRPYAMEDEDDMYVNEIDEIMPSSTPGSLRMPSSLGMPSIVSRDQIKGSVTDVANIEIDDIERVTNYNKLIESTLKTLANICQDKDYHTILLDQEILEQTQNFLKLVLNTMQQRDTENFDI